MVRYRQLALAAGTLLLGAALAARAQPAVRSRTFRLTYRAGVKHIPPGARSVDLWIPYPQSDANQTIHNITLHAPCAVTISRISGRSNCAVYVHQEHPGKPLQVTMEIVATRRENAGEPEALTPGEAKEYLKPEPLVPLDGAVRTLALEATAGKKTDAEKARAIYEKVTGMMKYDKSGAGWGRGDAVWACSSRRGNCTDFHALIIGMARSQGIPARFAIGLPLPAQRGRGEIPGYHCWAELFVKAQGWIPLDSSEAARALAAGDVATKDYCFGHHDENRLELSRDRRLVLSPPQKGEPLNFFVYPYAEVDGRKYDDVARKFTYEDLPTGGIASR